MTRIEYSVESRVMNGIADYYLIKTIVPRRGGTAETLVAKFDGLYEAELFCGFLVDNHIGREREMAPMAEGNDDYIKVPQDLVQKPRF